MKILGKEFKLNQLICLVLYYGIAKYLPSSQSLFWGDFSKSIRYILVKRIFKKCGKNVNIEKGVVFGRGTDVEIGDYSGLGINAIIPSNCKIGKYVMMAPNCRILTNNHIFIDTDIPMCFQGHTESKPIIIEDDVWIGRDVLIMPGRIIREGSIVAAGCVLCKDFPAYSIIGGNPSKLIKSRIQNDKVKE